MQNFNFSSSYMNKIQSLTTEHVVWWCVQADTSDPNVRFIRKCLGSRLDPEMLSGAMRFRYEREGGECGFRPWGMGGCHSTATKRNMPGKEISVSAHLCSAPPTLGASRYRQKWKVQVRGGYSLLLKCSAVSLHQAKN